MAPLLLFPHAEIESACEVGEGPIHPGFLWLITKCANSFKSLGMCKSVNVIHININEVDPAMGTIMQILKAVTSSSNTSFSFSRHSLLSGQIGTRKWHKYINKLSTLLSAKWWNIPNTEYNENSLSLFIRWIRVEIGTIVRLLLLRSIVCHFHE